ncbi:hypothetical protein J6590_036598 [Homalodisca vitripennis]|nr:hypothetical protein J6590_036598 [Homalodisca vitripennis]
MVEQAGCLQGQNRSAVNHPSSSHARPVVPTTLRYWQRHGHVKGNTTSEDLFGSLKRRGWGEEGGREHGDPSSK